MCIYIYIYILVCADICNTFHKNVLHICLYSLYTAQQMNFPCILWACLVCLLTILFYCRAHWNAMKCFVHFFFCQWFFQVMFFVVVRMKSIISDERLGRKQQRWPSWKLDPLREHLCMCERYMINLYREGLLCYSFILSMSGNCYVTVCVVTNMVG